jgi:2-succinyl-6-hydroxy-2,4-cyclohexadiene-1-carboxylate synthase
VRAWTPDLYSTGHLAPHHSLKEWVEHFFEELDSHCGGEPVQLVGYSMGARLALNALVREPGRFSRALLLSCRPFITPQEAESRRQWEMDWAMKFRSLPWNQLEQEWEAQGVFGSTQPLERRKVSLAQELQFREMLAQSLVHWSVTHHDLGPENLTALSRQVDWAFGALDQKFADVAKSLREMPIQGQISLLPGAGHRLPEDAPEWIRKWIESDSET